MNKKTQPPVKNQPKSAIKQQPKVARIWKAEDYVTTTVSLEEIQGIKEAFDIFDHNKSGLIEASQVKDAFTSLGFASQNKFVQRILNDYDTDHSSTIDFGEFVKLSTSRLGDTGSKAEVERVFNSFDTNKNGKISALDVKKIAEQLGQNFSDEEIDKMVFKADSDEDGYLTLDDFYNVLSNMNAQYE